MNKYLSILSIIFLLIITSCGTKKPSTKASFGLSFLVSDYETGGIMVFGKNNSNGSYFGKVLTTANSEVELDNGNWDFIAIGWSSATGKMVGVNKCGDIENVNLDGSDRNISFTMSAAECEDHDVFGPYPAFGSGFQLNPLRIVNCTNIDAVKTADEATTSTTCYPGALKSIKVFIPELLITGGVSTSNGLRSTCVDLGSRDVATTLKVPILNDPDGQVPLKVVIEGFSELGCSGSKQVYDGKTDLDKSMKMKFANSQNILFLHSNYCQGDKLTNLYSANTVTMAGAEYVICTRDQFVGAFSAPASKYVLGQNIDFLGEEMTQHNLTSTGGFNGLGNTLSNYTLNYTGSNTDIALFSTAQGIFENININKAMAIYDVTGGTSSGASLLIGKLTAPSTVKNISVSNSSLSLNSSFSGITNLKTGLVVGHSTFTNNLADIDISNSEISLDGLVATTLNEIGLVGGNLSGIFKKMSVNDSQIYTLNSTLLNTLRDVGALIGRTSGTSNYLYDAHINNFSVTSDSSSIIGQAVGGVIGYASELNEIKRAYSKFTFDFNSSAANHPDIGGIVGKLTHGGNPIHSFLKSDSIIKGQVTIAGGIIGNDLSTGSNNSYLFANVDIDGSSTCGGLIGRGNTTTIEYSNSTGKIKCLSGCIAGVIAEVNNSSSTIKYTSSSIELENNSTAGSGGIAGKYTSGTHTISNSLYNGNLNLSGGNTANGAFFGLSTGGSIAINNSIFNGNNSLNNNIDIGSNSIGYSTTSCKFLDLYASPALVSTCIKHTSDSTLIASLPVHFSADGVNTIWSNTGEIHLIPDKMNSSFMDTIGSSIKPFAIDNPAKWNLIGMLQSKDATHFSGANYILTADIDFQNGGITFEQWPELRGNFQGNGRTIRNISKNFGSASSGIFKKISEDSSLLHKVSIDSFRGLTLDNIHFDSTTASTEPNGILAAEIANVAGSTLPLTLKGIYVNNSSLNASGGGNGSAGIIGKINDSMGSPIFSVFLSDIYVTNTHITSTNGLSVGVLAGEFAKGALVSVPTDIHSITIDTRSSVDGTNANFVGGVIGSATKAKLQSVFGQARIESTPNNAGALVGSISGGSIIHSASLGNQIVSAGNAGAIAATCTSSPTFISTYSTYTDGSGPLALTTTGCVNYKSFSVSNSSGFNSAATSITYANLLSSEASAGSEIGTIQEGFYFDPGSYPKLRFQDLILKNIIR